MMKVPKFIRKFSKKDKPNRNRLVDAATCDHNLNDLNKDTQHLSSPSKSLSLEDDRKYDRENNLSNNHVKKKKSFSLNYRKILRSSIRREKSMDNLTKSKIRKLDPILSVDEIHKCNDAKDDENVLVYCENSVEYLKLIGGQCFAIFEPNIHPKFIRYCRNKNKTLLTTKRCQECHEKGSICVAQSIINNRLLQEIQVYFSRLDCDEKLEKFAIHIDGKKDCHIIKNETFLEFAKCFGSTLREFRFLSKYDDLSNIENSFDEKIIGENRNFSRFWFVFIVLSFCCLNLQKAPLLAMIYTSSDYFKNLVEFEVILGDQMVLWFFEKFASSFSETLKTLKIKIRLDLGRFHEYTIGVIESLKSMEKLANFHIELLPLKMNPISSNGLSTDLSGLLDVIGDLSLYINKVEHFSLAIDVNNVQLENLDLIKCLSHFRNAVSLSLLVYQHQPKTDSEGPHLNFDHLNTNQKLRFLSIDCATLTNQQVISLARNCSRLTSLNLNCDYRIDGRSIEAIRLYLEDLEQFSLGPAFSHKARKLGINVTDEDLKTLFERLDNGKTSNLKSIKIVQGRLRFDSSKGSRELIDALRMHVLSKERIIFSLVLEDNQNKMAKENLNRRIKIS